MKELIQSFKEKRRLTDREISTALTNYFKGGAIIEFSDGFTFKNESKRDEIGEIILSEENIIIKPNGNGQPIVPISIDYETAEFVYTREGTTHIPKTFRCGYSIIPPESKKIDNE